jgi:hypothetical protein
MKDFVKGWLEGFGVLAGCALAGFFLTIPFWRS